MKTKGSPVQLMPQVISSDLKLAPPAAAEMAGPLSSVSPARPSFNCPLSIPHPLVTHSFRQDIRARVLLDLQTPSLHNRPISLTTLWNQAITTSETVARHRTTLGAKNST
jgi:hypothetical protein